MIKKIKKFLYTLSGPIAAQLRSPQTPSLSHFFRPTDPTPFLRFRPPEAGAPRRNQARSGGVLLCKSKVSTVLARSIISLRSLLGLRSSPGALLRSGLVRSGRFLHILRVGCALRSRLVVLAYCSRDRICDLLVQLSMRFDWHCGCACGVTWTALFTGHDAPMGVSRALWVEFYRVVRKKCLCFY